jgi:hypothetical protein
MKGYIMRCYSCDEALTDYETTRKSLATGEYINLCQSCFSTIRSDCLAFGNPALMTDDDDTLDSLGLESWESEHYDDDPETEER